jgi:hypothetical protein
MTLFVRVLAVAAAAAGLCLAGCGRPQAAVRYLTGGPDEIATYDMAVCQLARNEKIQIILFHRTAAPIGVADPDFEYVFFELPDGPHYGWLQEDDVPAYRWVRHAGRDHIWQGSAGHENLWSTDSKAHVHFDFNVTMEPMAGTAGGAYVLIGNIRCTEDVVMAQGLINRYGDWLLSILGKKPKEAPPTKTPSPLKPKPPNPTPPGNSVTPSKPPRPIRGN